MSIAISLHLLAAVIWVGGMFFAYLALRPVAGALLESPLRLQLWSNVFDKFFPWVWAAILVLLVSGTWIIFAVYGGMDMVGLHVHLMVLLGLVMMAIFAHVYFAPYRRLKQAVARQDWSAGGSKLNHIRKLIAINLTLGIIVIVIATGGIYL